MSEEQKPNGSLDISEYLEKYGAILGKQAHAMLDPLHVPGRDPVDLPDLLREPYSAQQHVIMAGVEVLRKYKCANLATDMGTGKSLMAASVIHAHARGAPYRALVMCPGHLTLKWERELRETIPGINVHQVESYVDFVRIKERRPRAYAPRWYVIGKDRAKLGAGIVPAFWNRRGEVVCPKCGGRVCDQKGAQPLPDDMGKRWLVCEHVRRDSGTGNVVVDGCGEQLWQMVRKPDRYEPAKFAHKHLKSYFDYLVLDEIQGLKGDDTAQANAAGSFIAAAKRVVTCTGTLTGGYAEHIRPILFRTSPRSLRDEGFTWEQKTSFSEKYGRIETKVIDKPTAGKSNRQSRGSTRTSTKYVRPGIMPTLFGRHLMKNTIFLALEDVADNLPDLEERVWPVEMDDTMAEAYQVMESSLKDAIKQMLVRGDRRLLGVMLNTLLAWPDYPYGWDSVGYNEGDVYIPVCSPENLDPDVITPKEQRLVDVVQYCVSQGHQCWVYCTFNSTHDVQTRLERILKGAGLRVAGLRASVSPTKREEWIARWGPRVDVCVSHPQLVETGLDLFDKHGSYNFSSLIFYETGYNPFVLMQAGRRSWRLAQTKDCQVHYLWWENTMQARAMTLMGKKIAASMALAGQFTTDGLAALADDGEGMEMQLARSLANQMGDMDAGLAWEKLTAAHQPKPPATIPIRRDAASSEFDRFYSEITGEAE